MLPLLWLGERLHPEFDIAFLSNLDKSQAGTPSDEQVRWAWSDINAELRKGFEQMSESDWGPEALGRIGGRFRQRSFAQSLRDITEPYEPSLLSPRTSVPCSQSDQEQESEVSKTEHPMSLSWNVD